MPNRVPDFSSGFPGSTRGDEQNVGAKMFEEIISAVDAVISDLEVSTGLVRELVKFLPQVHAWLPTLAKLIVEVPYEQLVKTLPKQMQTLCDVVNDGVIAPASLMPVARTTILSFLPASALGANETPKAIAQQLKTHVAMPAAELLDRYNQASPASVLHHLDQLAQLSSIELQFDAALLTKLGDLFQLLEKATAGLYQMRVFVQGAISQPKLFNSQVSDIERLDAGARQLPSALRETLDESAMSQTLTTLVALKQLTDLAARTNVRKFAVVLTDLKAFLGPATEHTTKVLSPNVTPSALSMISSPSPMLDRILQILGDMWQFSDIDNAKVRCVELDVRASPHSYYALKVILDPARLDTLLRLQAPTEASMAGLQRLAMVLDGIGPKTTLLSENVRSLRGILCPDPNPEDWPMAAMGVIPTPREDNENENNNNINNNNNNNGAQSHEMPQAMPSYDVVGATALM